MLTSQRGQPRLLLPWGTGQRQQFAEGDDRVHTSIRAGPVGYHLGADQQLARLLQRVMEPLRLGPRVLWPLLLAQGLQHGLQGSAALWGKVAIDAAGVVGRRAQLQVPVIEPVIGVVRVGLLGPPPLIGGAGHDRQVFEVGAGRGGVDQQLVDALAQLRRELAGPAGHLRGPRLAHLAAR